MFELFRKEDPNLKRNREAQKLREMQQGWKQRVEPLRPLRKRVPKVILFRNSNCSDVRGGILLKNVPPYGVYCPCAASTPAADT